MEKCKISVIIPVYNTALYVGMCLNSVIGQGFDAMEVICVNDGSKDNSLDILLQYEKLYEKVHVISYEKNQGVAHARNIGLKAAKGKYVYFLDSDDWLINGALQQLYDLANEMNTDCILFCSELAMETQGIGSPTLEFELPQYEGRIFTGEEVFQIMIEHDRYTSSVWRQFWTKQFLLENDCFFVEGALAEDAFFSFNAYLQAGRVAITNRKYHVYRRHGGTFSTLVSPEKCQWLFRAFCDMLRIWMNKNYAEETNRAIAKRVDVIYKQLKRLYFRNKGLVEENFASERERYLFHILFVQSVSSPILISPEKLEQIRKFPQVVVYGAAGYAMDVTESLKYNGINILCYLVTELHENAVGTANIPVYSIKEFSAAPDECMIVLGVTKKNREDVVATLEKYHFKNYIELD